MDVLSFFGAYKLTSCKISCAERGYEWMSHFMSKQVVQHHCRHKNNMTLQVLQYINCSINWAIFRHIMELHFSWRQLIHWALEDHPTSGDATLYEAASPFHGKVLSRRNYNITGNSDQCMYCGNGVGSLELCLPACYAMIDGARIFIKRDGKATVTWLCFLV